MAAQEEGGMEMINYSEYECLQGPARSSRQKTVKDEFANLCPGGHAAAVVVLLFAIRYNNVLIIIIIIVEEISKCFTPFGQLTATAIRAIFINDPEENK